VLGSRRTKELIVNEYQSINSGSSQLPFCEVVRQILDDMNQDILFYFNGSYFDFLRTNLTDTLFLNTDLYVPS
jgi:hypothetical protein